MEFNYIVSKWYRYKNKIQVFGGFLDLEIAKHFTEIKKIDSFTDGYFYIKAPEGIYVYGTEISACKSKWYKPNEEAFVYSYICECVVPAVEILE